MSEAIYIVEYASVPVGIDMLDKMVKRASVSIVYAKPVCIGKFLIVLGGEVGAVLEAKAAVEAQPEKKLMQQHLLTSAHQDILAYFNRAPVVKENLKGSAAIGIVETRDAASGFRSLDAALKSGSVQLEQVWIGHFMGGKFCYILSGEVGDVDTACKAAEQKSLVSFRVLPAPDHKTLKYLIKAYTE